MIVNTWDKGWRWRQEEKSKTSEYVVNEDMHKVISDLDLDRTPLLTLNVDLMSSYISQEVDVRLCGR